MYPPYSDSLMSLVRTFLSQLARTLPCLLLASAFGAQGALTNLNINLVTNVQPSASPISYGDVWAENDLACLGVWLGYSTYNYGVGIYSISNPAAPVLLSIYRPSPSGQNQFELGAVRNRIGYFGSWSGGGVHIVSLTNPASPVLLCRIGATTGNVTNGFDRVHTLFLERDYLYEAAHVDGIQTVKVFNVSNPSAPVFLQNVATTNTFKVHQMTVGNKGAQVILYTSGWGNSGNSPGQTDIWDVTQIGSQPAQWLGRIYSGNNSHSSWPTPDGNILVVCRETAGGDVRLYDISNPAAIPSNAVPIVTLTPAKLGIEPGIPHNPVVVGNFLFLSWYQNGIQIFNLADPSKPVRVGFYDTFPDPVTSSFEGNWGVFPQLGFSKLLLSDIQRGLFIMDASAVLAPANNYPPLIVTQPASMTVNQGVTAAFTPSFTGSQLAYQWRFNNSPIPGATSSSLNLTNVQSSQAGSYTVVVSNSTLAITSSIASLSVITPQNFQTIFFEPFDTATTSTNWNLYDGSGSGISDYTVDWSFDYSTYFSVFHGTTIPPAPNTTNGFTRGLRLTVNNNDTFTDIAGVSLYPKDKNFSGAYKLLFDMWINYPGTAGGGTGSTEHGTFGLNHAGTRVNWDSATSTPSDGIWFAVDGEGGGTGGNDYRAFLGNSSGRPFSLSFAASGLSASGASSFNNADPYFQSIFPSPTYETAGAPGKRWIQVEISQDANHVVTWRMNGNLIAQRPNTSIYTNGTVMIGYMDLFTSIANPAADAFILFDNVRVTVAGTSAPPVITSHPQNISVYPEQDVTLSVAVTGSAPLSFQWLFNGAAIAGATSNSFTKVNVQAEDVGYYSVTVNNSAGVAVSSNALVSLLDSPYLQSVHATPGARSSLISWNTVMPANSRVQFDPATIPLPSGASEGGAMSGFSSSSYLDPVLKTNHVILLTGLTPGSRYNFQAISAVGTNTYVSGVYQFTTAGEIILDNTQATFTGSWTTNNISTDKYGADYAFATAVAGAPTATATFRPNIITPGKYDVYVWYPQGANRANNAPYTLSYNGGDTTSFVNQQAQGGGWVLIGSDLEFARGTQGFVRLANNANPAVVIADAVRFVYVEAQDFPTTPAVPTWWHNFFFATTTDPLTDPDGDGYTTSQEYVIGTSPTNKTSHLQFTGESATNQTLVKFWPLLGNRTYQLLYRSQLGLPSWQTVPAGSIMPTPDGEGIFAFYATNAPQNFYRLKVELSTNPVFGGSLAVPPGKSYSPFASEPMCGPNRAYIR